MTATIDAYRAHCFRGVHVGDAEAGRLTMLDLLAEQASRVPDAPSITEVIAGARTTVTFRQLHELSLRGAVWLATNAKLRPRETLALIPANDLRSVVVIFSALRLGARIAFLDPGAPPARQHAIAEALGVQAVLRSSAVPAGIDALVAPELGELPPAGVDAPAVDPAMDTFYFGTSGSTATSKIVAQTHRATVANALAVRRHHALRTGDRLLSCLPIHHVNGLHFTVMATVASGAHAILVHRFDPIQCAALIVELAPRLVSVVPSLLQALALTWRAGKLPDGFESFVSAAAPLPRDLARAVWDKWRVRVLQGYGLTEAINFSTTVPANLSEAAYVRQMLDADIPTIGTAIDGNEVAVLHPDGRLASDGEQGEVCIRGHNVMDRYVGNPEETDQAFRDGWLHTGDLGFLRSDVEAGSGFVVITGRAKNMAKVRGESVSLEELERSLLMVEGIHDAACTTIPDRMLGEAIIAVVVAEDRVSDATIYERLRITLAPGWLPSTLLRMPAIPRTPTGKVLRPQLREHVASMLQPG